MTHRWVLNSFTSRVKLLKSDSRTPAAGAAAATATAKQRPTHVMYACKWVPQYGGLPPAQQLTTHETQGAVRGGEGREWHDKMLNGQRKVGRKQLCMKLEEEINVFQISVPLACEKLIHWHTTNCINSAFYVDNFYSVVHVIISAISAF